MLPRSLLIAYVVLGAANVVGNAGEVTALCNVTKPLLVPLLLAWLVIVARAAFVVPLRWLAAGLVFAWLGDMFLMGEGDGYFIGGLAAFLVMQVCYILAFTRIPGPGFVRAWKVALVPYVAIWVIVNALVTGGVGSLRIPVLVYSAVLVTMAVAALDLVLRIPRRQGWRICWGALLFLVSDALIAMSEFGPLSPSPTISALVMAIYTAAQAMIVTGMAGPLKRTHAAAAQSPG